MSFSNANDRLHAMARHIGETIRRRVEHRLLNTQVGRALLKQYCDSDASQEPSPASYHSGNLSASSSSLGSPSDLDLIILATSEPLFATSSSMFSAPPIFEPPARAHDWEVPPSIPDFDGTDHGIFTEADAIGDSLYVLRTTQTGPLYIPAPTTAAYTTEWDFLQEAERVTGAAPNGLYAVAPPSLDLAQSYMATLSGIPSSEPASDYDATFYEDLATASPSWHPQGFEYSGTGGQGSAANSFEPLPNLPQENWVAEEDFGLYQFPTQPSAAPAYIEDSYPDGDFEPPPLNSVAPTYVQNFAVPDPNPGTGSTVDERSLTGPTMSTPSFQRASTPKNYKSDPAATAQKRAISDDDVVENQHSHAVSGQSRKKAKTETPLPARHHERKNLDSIANPPTLSTGNAASSSSSVSTYPPAMSYDFTAQTATSSVPNAPNIQKKKKQKVKRSPAPINHVDCVDSQVDIAGPSANTESSIPFVFHTFGSDLEPKHYVKKEVIQAQTDWKKGYRHRQPADRSQVESTMLRSNFRTGKANPMTHANMKEFLQDTL